MSRDQEIACECCGTYFMGQIGDDHQCADCAQKHAAEVESLRVENQELKDALMDMVAQHCYDPDEKGRCFSGALSANAGAMRLLGRLGLMRLDDRGMRMVYGWWPERSDK